jgi:hypothetical protein
MRLRPGTTSVSSSSRLLANAADVLLKPVMFPRRLRGRTDRWSSAGDQHVHREPHQVGRQCGQPLVLALGKPGLDANVLPLDIAEVAQPLPERFGEGSGGRKGLRRKYREVLQGCQRSRITASPKAPKTRPPLLQWGIPPTHLNPS